MICCGHMLDTVLNGANCLSTPSVPMLCLKDLKKEDDEIYPKLLLTVRSSQLEQVAPVLATQKMRKTIND